MKPLFTIHGGEYLVGSHIELHFNRVNVWIPSRDKGADLLVSDRHNRRSLSLQVKSSKDFLVTHMGPSSSKIFGAAVGGRSTATSFGLHLPISGCLCYSGSRDKQLIL